MSESNAITALEQYDDWTPDRNAPAQVVTRIVDLQTNDVQGETAPLSTIKVVASANSGKLTPAEVEDGIREAVERGWLDEREGEGYALVTQGDSDL
jgi:hypothetical protein